MKHFNNILVLKVGTNTLTKTNNYGYECLDTESFKQISQQIHELQNNGTGVVIVSSGAITAGMSATKLSSRPKHMPDLQRLASIGWRQVLYSWSEALSPLIIGELLLTRSELNLAHERNEALHVIHSLLAHGQIAVVNENDAISHTEIAFGDNDTLAAILAAKIKKSGIFTSKVKLVILSDINGVYADPNKPSSIIKNIENIDTYSHLAKETTNCNGTGGMITKFVAAKIATNNGVDMWIANGRQKNIIKNALNGKAGTHFIAK